MPLDAKSAASASFKKLMGVVATLFGKGFRSSKCKTEVKLATARIKLLRNRREAQIRQMRRDIATLLRSGQDTTARIRVEHVIREQNIFAANEIIELFCELVVARLSIIAKQRNCPADLREGIASLIFAAPRCSEIPELQRIRDIFEKKYGKDFVSAATDLRPESGVNRSLIEKLSVRTPPGVVKLKILKEIAKEYQIEWDTTETEQELLKPPEEHLEGPRSFVSAANMPEKSTVPWQGDSSLNQPDYRYSKGIKDENKRLNDTVSAARAATELAEKAVAVAQAAAQLVTKQSSFEVDKKVNRSSSVGHQERSSSRRDANPSRTVSVNSVGEEAHSSSSNHSVTSKHPSNNHNLKTFQDTATDQDVRPLHVDHREKHTRVVRSDIRFDDSDGLESDCEEELEPKGQVEESSHPPPARAPPPLFPPPSLPSSFARDLDDIRSPDSCDMQKPDPSSRVHPKLPDYEDLSVRFEALKLRRLSK